MKYFFVVGLLSVMLFSACKHDPALPSPDPVTPPDTTTTNPVNPGFAKDILPIFQLRCTSCHNANNANDGFIFTSYETITSKKFVPGDPDETKLYEKITEDDPDDRMPLPPNPPLTDAQITMIRNWILAGAPNN